MEKPYNKQEDLSHEENARLVLDYFHRTIMHHAMWFAEAQHQFGPEKAREIMDSLKYDYMCQYDEKDAIGRRYRRQDAIGTPYCITVDHQTLEDNTVTIRERDSMKQDRIIIEKISGIIAERIND